MSKYLITGVMGFVGRYFTEYLQQHEPQAQILGIDRASTCDTDICHKTLDLSNAEAVAQCLTEFQPDYILHLASISSVGQSWQDPVSCFQNNTNIMLNLLEAVSRQHLKSRILAIGSSEEYGNCPETAMPLKETQPLQPANPYAVAKTSQELLCRLYAESMNVDVVMTRSFNHIGPRQSDRFVIPSFIKQLVEIKRGKQKQMLVGNIRVKRDFLDVRDVVDAYYKLLHNGVSGEVYNVCSGTSVALSEVIDSTAKILDIQPNIAVDEGRVRPNDIALILGDNSKLCQLGWKPQYSFEQTIKDMITFWQIK